MKNYLKPKIKKKKKKYIYTQIIHTYSSISPFNLTYKTPQTVYLIHNLKQVFESTNKHGRDRQDHQAKSHELHSMEDDYDITLASEEAV